MVLQCISLYLVVTALLVSTDSDPLCRHGDTEQSQLVLQTKLTLKSKLGLKTSGQKHFYFTLVQRLTNQLNNEPQLLKLDILLQLYMQNTNRYFLYIMFSFVAFQHN